MSNHWIDPNDCHSLAVLVETVVGPMLIQHEVPICLELDIDTSMGVPEEVSKTVDLLQALVNQALEEMPSGGDLNVTAFDSPTGIELEIADTGCDIEQREKRLPLVAASIGASLAWQNCPQGGGAVTIKFPSRHQVQRRVA